MQKVAASIILAISLCLSSCGPNREDAVSKIKEVETKALSDSTKLPSRELAYNLQLAYMGFVDKFPNDSASPGYAFKAANISMKMGWGQSAIEYLDKYLAKFPNDKQVPEAMFYKAYIYDNQLNDDAKAGVAYNAFLEKFPNHAFSADAKASIKNLGKSDEELIREFEKMNSDSAAPAPSTKI